jgi:hypothetical protein
MYTLYSTLAYFFSSLKTKRRNKHTCSSGRATQVKPIRCPHLRVSAIPVPAPVPVIANCLAYPDATAVSSNVISLHPCSTSLAAKSSFATLDPIASYFDAATHPRTMSRTKRRPRAKSLPAQFNRGFGADTNVRFTWTKQGVEFPTSNHLSVIALAYSSYVQ